MLGINGEKKTEKRKNSREWMYEKKDWGLYIMRNMKLRNEVWF